MRQRFPQRILYLVPDLFGLPGGIARYCRMVCMALSNTDNLSITVLALNDACASVAEANTFLPSISYKPCDGQRPVFVRRVLRAAALRPTMIMVGHPHFAPLGWLVARLTRSPLVVFMYGIEVWRPMTPLRRLALRQAEGLIAISKFTAQHASRANNLPLEKLRILNNCLDPTFENLVVKSGDALRSAGSEGSSLSIITVSRMSRLNPYKGHSLIIKAMPALAARYPNLVCKFVGDGDARPILEEMAEREQVSHVIRFHGVISDEELSRQYRESSLFLLPSQSEGFGFVFLEAMAHGIPAIGGSRDATQEVIIHGRTGYVIDPSSVESLVEATSRLLGNPALRKKMGSAAYAHAFENFSFEAFRQRLLSHLSHICTKHRNQARF